MQIVTGNRRAGFCSRLPSHFIVFISGFSKSFSQTQGKLVPTSASATVYFTLLPLCHRVRHFTVPQVPWQGPVASRGAITAETWDP